MKDAQLAARDEVSEFSPIWLRTPKVLDGCICHGFGNLFGNAKTHAARVFVWSATIDLIDHD